MRAQRDSGTVPTRCRFDLAAVRVATSPRRHDERTAEYVDSQHMRMRIRDGQRLIVRSDGTTVATGAKFTVPSRSIRMLLDFAEIPDLAQARPS